MLAIARPWCKGAGISHEDVTRATSHTMFGTAWPAVFGKARVVPVAALLFEGVNESITECQGKDAVLVASASDLWHESSCKRSMWVGYAVSLSPEAGKDSWDGVTLVAVL